MPDSSRGSADDRLDTFPFSAGETAADAGHVDRRSEGERFVGEPFSVAERHHHVLGAMPDRHIGQEGLQRSHEIICAE